MRILVAEDTLTTRTMLERTLRKWGYEVSTVNNSNDALELLQKEPIQIVLTDWIMPGGDGLALCRDIRALNRAYYTYIILITALENAESATKGLQAGADDFIRKPLLLDELHARIKAGERILALEKNLQIKNVDLIRAQDLINRDLQTAAKMQKDLLPSASAKYLNVSIDWLFCPSAMVSGDIFNFFRLDETHVGFYSLDVAGHGVSAAMMSFSLFRLLTTEMQRGSPLKQSIPDKPYYQIVPPVKVMSALNAQFQTSTETWLYFTMIYGIVNTDLQTIELCQAGHPDPVYIDTEGTVRFVGEGGFPVGITESAEYESITINYRPGDRLILYSDGITECMGTNGEMFGAERLLEFLNESKSLPIHGVSMALNQMMQTWRGDEYYEDDVSMLVLEMA